ncbi:E3 UFM1-protein ligase 1 homolog [Tribolium castaneum]|uniref:E3 UFM1-protein ligase 1 homolog n=1 Tax=Tribolium castaneum TaxID=7070 RepID=D6WAW0_TRICA|nr:PREDICTED: E3 UFM1-protein ligase 1 homolog [Tribolium castaneum]EEZ97941.1 E3 UFM1-protein ligase 1 homolog-like Protein [Tribolium castaneum]|eukprot:XP_969461.1 PREDICTED: E3 UFM1-protein ligase 1 homolog [Tribolium castaneum]
MADWEEIKRLAADFQKVQLSSTSQKLSERNCIEIINYLKEKKIIDLIFTVDGKEFLTPSHLIQDIKNELFVSGGRINLVELAKNIGVDLAHITAHLKDVLKGQKDLHSILGQLIDSSYITKIAGEINEKLAQQGQISISDLTIQYDLSAEFLQQQVVEKHLGKIIHGKQDTNDPRVIFTESFIARCKAKIRGALCGLTRPTPVASILNQISLSEKLFFSLFDQTSMHGALTSRVVGAQYIPNVYARSQNEWVNNFYKQNDYLEYDALARLGISDYKSFIKKQLSSEDLVFLNSCAASKRVLERAEADIDECISSKSYLDLQSNLPSVFNDKDIRLILDTVLTKQKQQQTIVIENFILSKAFIENLSKNFDELVKEKAKAVVESGKYQQYQTDIQISSSKPQKFEEVDEKVDKREERRKKAAGGKSGGGTQGRETKTKSTKKAKKHVEEEFETVERRQQLQVVLSEDIADLIQKELEEDGLDELSEPLTQYLLPQLNEKGLEIAGEIYAATIADRTANRRQTHNELQNKLNALIGDVRLFEKGLKLLPEELQGQLVKYLLKTLCTDITTEILNYVAAEQNLNTQTDNFTNEQRLKFVNELPPDLKKSLLPLIKSLSGQSIDEFMAAVEESLSVCSMIIKKIDKKKDRTIVLNHKHVLLEQLNKCDDLALVLHLTTLIIFTTATQCMLHASGRHVAAILSFLKQYLTDGQVAELTSYHDFVTLMLSGGSEAESAKEKLKEKIQTVKNIANEFKKPGAEKS